MYSDLVDLFTFNITCITMYYMRQILNISLPKEMAESIKKDARAQNSSVSEFIRTAVRAYKTYRLVRIVKKGEKEYREGKTVAVNSIRELL